MTDRPNLPTPSPSRPSARGRLAGAVALAALVLGLAPSPSRADLTIQVLDSSAPAGGTGSFDVVLINTDAAGTTPYSVNSFSVEVSVPGGSGVSFTAADTGTTAAPYIFGTLQTPPFTFDTFPTQDVTVSDFAAPGSAMLVNPGDEFGLGHFTYSLTAGFTGPVTVTLGGGTSLTDPNANAITFVSGNGTISTRPVPEPSTLMMAALGGSMLLGYARRRTRSRVA